MSTSAERMRRLRERRAAALVPIGGQPPRPADELLGPAVEETLSALQLGERDAGAAQLARSYARLIDQAPEEGRVAALRAAGPLLLKALQALGATPASRAAAGGKQPRRQPPSQLAKLRAAHAQTVARRQAGPPGA
jgi:hypothetical protein